MYTCMERRKTAIDNVDDALVLQRRWLGHLPGLLDPVKDLERVGYL